jgi:hypothetical protein
MKRCILSLFLLASFNLLAQETTIGLRLGVNASKFKIEGGNSSIQNIMAVNAFVPVNIPISGNFSLQPEFGVIQKGVKSTAFDGDYSAKIKQKLTYVEMPVLAKYTMQLIPKLQASAFLGPSLGYCLTGKVKYWENDAGTISEETEKTDFKRDNIRRIDLGFNIGAAAFYELGDGNVTFDIRLQPGISDLNKASFIAVKNMSFIMSLGYIIKL